MINSANEKTTKLIISTPKGIFYENHVYLVSLKTSQGYIGLQVNHMPFISNIEISSLYIYEQPLNRENNEIKKAAIGGGLVFAEKDYIDIFTDDIEWASEIVKSDVEKQIELAHQQLEEAHRIQDRTAQHKNELMLKKAINKLSTLNK